jgi:uncharacterized UPF0160 family protein
MTWHVISGRPYEKVFGHGFVTKLSSAGLVYKHFGREIIASTLEFPLEDPRVEKIYLKAGAYTRPLVGST